MREYNRSREGGVKLLIQNSSVFKERYCNFSSSDSHLVLKTVRLFLFHYQRACSNDAKMDPMVKIVSFTEKLNILNSLH